MIDGVILRPLTVNADTRGWLTELWRSDEWAALHMPLMCYASLTLPGVTRGPHEHKKQSDLFAFFGPGLFRVSLYDGRRDSGTYGRKFEFEAGDRQPLAVLVPPGVLHGYTNIGDGPALSFNCPDQLYAGWGKRGPVDELRHEEGPGWPKA